MSNARLSLLAFRLPSLAARLSSKRLILLHQPPRQRRSQEKVGFILEAAAQVLEAGGEPAFNTNAIAKRAGVSIGALYRYFPNKAAILHALAEREIDAHRGQWRAVLATRPPDLAPDRAMIRVFLQAFGGRTRARRVAMRAWFAQVDPAQVAANLSSDVQLTDARGVPLPPLRSFVLSRALVGAMRAAVLEGADFLLEREFEDELVRLARSFVAG